LSVNAGSEYVVKFELGGRFKKKFQDHFVSRETNVRFVVFCIINIIDVKYVLYVFLRFFFIFLQIFFTFLFILQKRRFNVFWGSTFLTSMIKITPI
jgi:hypothetical protein